MDERNINLSEYRLQRAKQCLVSANALITIEDYQGAANRIYYAVFHCMRSVLAVEGVDFAKHAGVISYYRKNYIKTGIFATEFSKTIAKAFNMRSDSDYEDFYVVSKSDVTELLDEVTLFYVDTEKYLHNTFREDK